MRPRVVILGGAGAMGRIIARDFLRTSRGAVDVVVADRESALAAFGSTDLLGSSRKMSPSRSNRRTSTLRDGRAVHERPGLQQRTAPIRMLDEIRTVAVDVADPSSLRAALSGAYAVIASLPYRFNLAAMRGALDAGTHYIDLGGLFHMTRQQLALAPEFERAGLMAILGAGSAPGIINLLAVRAAEGMDEVREVHCLVGSIDRTRFTSAPPLGFGYSVDTLLDEFAMPSAVFRKGTFVMVPPLDPRERRTIRFPPPLGSLSVDTTLHSEVATLPLHFASRGIREVTFRQGFDREFMEKLTFLVKLGLADVETVRLPAADEDASPPVADGRALPRMAVGARGRDEGGGHADSWSRLAAAVDRAAPISRAGTASALGGQREPQVACLEEDPPTARAHSNRRESVLVSPRQILLALLGRLPAAVPRGRPIRYEVLRALVTGRKGRRSLSVIADCHAGPRSGSGTGPDIDTGAPPSIAAQLLISGELPVRPGVWAPEQVIPVQPFIRELERRGMRVTHRAGRPLSRI